MRQVSKPCPSDPSREASVEKVAAKVASVISPSRLPRVFRNSYTRAGRRYVTSGWVVKLQHQGQRRTFSLRAKTKTTATMEAKGIWDTLQTEGWSGVLVHYSNARKAETGADRMDDSHWRDRLVVRRYGFPATSGTPADLAARVDHAGIGFWFPLGTPDADLAATKARQIYETAVQRGWEECGRRFSRELIIGFEWCSNPILWTYATIHTLVDKTNSAPARNGAPPLNPVLIVEPDAGIRRALAWSINQHQGFQAITCQSTELFDYLLESGKPRLVLLNRNLAERVGADLPGRIAVIRAGVPALTYSVAVDGDQLFVSTPGGAEGYLIRRAKPDHLLAPILPGGGGGIPAGELLPRVKSYFKELLQPRSDLTGTTLGRLTPRENEVLVLLSKGWVDKEIAQTLGISAWTVHGHIKNIFERLRVRTRTEAVVRYLEK
jgi:DNA-binding NarL/FixJ family response regulator